MNALKPEFKDKYGHPYEYADDKEIKPVGYYGIVWELDKKANKVVVTLSHRPYAGTGGARQWVNRQKNTGGWYRKYFEFLDGTILNANSWELVDRD